MATYFHVKSPVFSAVARPPRAGAAPGADAERVLVSAGGGAAKTGVKNLMVRVHPR
jgi:hypothetical protein